MSKTEQCPKCAERGKDTDGDNLHTYDWGKKCVACGYTISKYQGLELIPGVINQIPERGLTKATCDKYRIQTATFTGYINKSYPQVKDELIYIFNIYDKQGRVTTQQIRSKAIKNCMGMRGKGNPDHLFGQDKFHPNKDWMLLLSEAPFKAAAAYQIMNCPSVSGVSGALGSLQTFDKNYEWLSGWREIIYIRDPDDAGKEAAERLLGMFEPGYVRIASPPQDADKMLIDGRADEFKKCVWNAERVKPSTIVFPEDIEEKIFTPPKFGSPWPWPSMTKATYGRRKGELYLLAAATSVGKTEIVREIVFHLLENGEKAGVFSLEQQPEQTMQRYIGSAMNERLYLPGCAGWDEEVMRVHYQKFKRSVALYQPCSGLMSLDALTTNIRWLTKAEGMEFFIIDNLKALATNPQIDGKKTSLHDFLSYAQGTFFRLVKELNINIFVLNHLAEDKIAKQAYVSTSPKHREEYLERSSEEMQKFINRPGMTWETGRVPSIENIFGGGNIKDLTDYILVASRNRMSEDYDEHRTIKVKFLKTRLDSLYENFTFNLMYDYSTGRLEECYNTSSNKNVTERFDE